MFNATLESTSLEGDQPYSRIIFFVQNVVQNGGILKAHDMRSLYKKTRRDQDNISKLTQIDPQNVYTRTQKIHRVFMT